MARRKESQFRKWAIGLGLPALMFSIGMGLMGWVSFWVGVAFVYGALFWLGADWWKLSRTKRRRYIGTAVTGLVMAVLGYLVFRPAPLLAIVEIVGSEYSAGQVAGGITWGPGLGDLRVTLSNESDRDYNDLDIVLEVGQDQSELPQIIEIAQLSTIPNVSFTTQPFSSKHVHLTLFDLKTTMQVEALGTYGSSPESLLGKNEKGESKNIPITPPSNEQLPSPRFRILCDKLPKHMDLKLIAAVAITNPPTLTGLLPTQLFAPFRSPSCVRVRIEYNASNRPISIHGDCYGANAP